MTPLSHMPVESQARIRRAQAALDRCDDVLFAVVKDCSLSDLHDFVLVLAKQKHFFVLTGQNTIAKQKMLA